MWTRAEMIENYNYWSDSRTIESLVSDDSCFVKGSKTEIDMNWVREKWDDWSFDEELVQGQDDWTVEQWNQATEEAWKNWLKSLGARSTVVVDSRFEVCSTCNGRGTHVNPSIDSGGITASEWAEWDEEEREHYWSGSYDVSCYQCHGEKVIQNLEYETENKLYNWCCERLNEHYESQYESAREMAEERRWGA